METRLIDRLNHMRDLSPADTDYNLSIAARAERRLAEAGFRRLETPVIERTDLFVRKSGGEVSSSLYTFSDPGGISVSLRPEFTPSVIRWFIENRPDQRRYRYSGPVFRYGGARGGRFRQFHQVGGELLGAPGAEGDSEILGVARRCLEAGGVADCVLHLGHIGVIRDLLRAVGLSEQTQMFIVANIDDIAAGAGYEGPLVEKATAAGLVADSASALTGMTDVPNTALPVLDALQQTVSGATGRRSPEQIMSRLVGRARRASSKSEFEEAAGSVARLVAVNGSPSEVVAEADAILRDCEASLASLNSLESTLEAVTSDGWNESSIRLDLAFVRGMAYYTGAVFEFLPPNNPKSPSPPKGEGRGEGEPKTLNSTFPLGGGGRYDDLVRAFGGPDMPACGFALNIDEVAWTARRRGERG